MLAKAVCEFYYIPDALTFCLQPWLRPSPLGCDLKTAVMLHHWLLAVWKQPAPKHDCISKECMLQNMWSIHNSIAMSSWVHGVRNHRMSLNSILFLDWFWWVWRQPAPQTNSSGRHAFHAMQSSVLHLSMSFGPCSSMSATLAQESKNIQLFMCCKSCPFCIRKHCLESLGAWLIKNP